MRKSDSNAKYRFLCRSLTVAACGMTLLIMQPMMRVSAEELTSVAAAQERDIVASGGISGSYAKWSLDADGVMTITGSGQIVDLTSDVHSPWYDYREQINKVIIGPDINQIGDYAFDGCPVKEIEIGTGVTRIGKKVLGHSLESLYIPANVKEIDAISELSVEQRIDVEASNTSFASDEMGVLFNKEKTILYKAPHSLSGKYTIPDTVTTIKEEAFNGCKNLKELVIPDTVTQIENGALNGCQRLQTLTFGNGVTNIDKLLSYSVGLDSLQIINLGKSVVSYDYPFNNFQTIKEINVSEENPYYCSEEGVMYSKEKTTLYCYPKSKSGTFTIPNTVTKIKDRAFNGSALTDIVAPDSVTELGTGAFSNCISLQTVMLSDNVWKIPTDCFTNCPGLSSINLPSKLTWVDNHAFQNCTSITELKFPKTLEMIYEGAFKGCTALKTVTFTGGYPYRDSGWSGINASAFSGVTAECRYPSNNLTWTSDKLAQYGGTLTWTPYDVNVFEDEEHTYTIPDTNITLAYKINPVLSTAKITLCNPDATGTLEIPKEIDGYTVTAIGDSAFEKCVGITSVTMPQTITELGASAFRDCTGLKSATLSDQIETISDYAFSKCPLQTVNFPEKLREVGVYAFEQMRVSNLVLPENVTYHDYCFYNSEVNDVVLPADMTDVPDRMFSGSHYLHTIKFPSVLKTIGDASFQGCFELYSIELPEGLVSLGYQAFSGCGACITFAGYYDCYNFRSVKLPSTLRTIGAYAFYRCEALYSINIPEHITDIPSNAFGQCRNLASITIPANIKTIGQDAFYQCEKLTTVTFLWNAPEIYRYAFGAVSGTIYYPSNNPAWSSNVVANYKSNQPSSVKWVAKQMEQPAESIDIVIDDKSNDVESGEGTSVIPPEKGWTAGKNTFKVNSGSPCVVVISNDGGQTYTKLEAAANDDGSYTFTAEDMTEDTTLTVLKKGDINGDGAVKNSDVLLGSAALLGKQTLTELQKMAADVSGDGDFTNADITALMAAILGKGSMSW